MSHAGYESNLPDFQFILPTNMTNPKTYYMYYCPKPTQRKARGGGGGGAPHDYDDASFSDIEEIVVGTDINDPNDYPGEHVATQTSAITTTHTPAVMPTPVIPRLTWAYYLFLINTIVASIMIGLVTFYYFFKQPAKKWQAGNSK